MISLLLYILAAICNAGMDTLQHHHGNSIFKNTKPFSFFGQHNWSRKYKDNNPAAGARFPGSKTVFVFLMDGWHLFQWFMLGFLSLSIVTFESSLISGWESLLAVLIVYRVSWGLVFELFYQKIFYSKGK